MKKEKSGCVLYTYCFAFTENNYLSPDWNTTTNSSSFTASKQNTQQTKTNYLKQYNTLLQKHYDRTVLQHLPKDAWKKLDEPEMIDSPNLEQFDFYWFT